MIRQARAGLELDVLQAVLASNSRHKGLVIERIANAVGALEKAHVAVFGLTFKAETDDVRESPAIAIANELRNAGANVTAFDPEGGPNARSLLSQDIVVCGSQEQAAAGADVIVILTEWNEFRNLDYEMLSSQMRGRAIVDARNVLDPRDARSRGFHYQGMGRGEARPEADE